MMTDHPCLDFITYICLKVVVSRDFLAFFSWIEPMINMLNWFFLKIRFRGDIHEISDSAQANTLQSQTLKKWIYMKNMLIFRKICGNLMLANTAQSFAGTDFFLYRPLIALIEIITFFKDMRIISIKHNVFVSFLKG